MLDSSRNRRRHESGAINLEEDQRNTAVEVRGGPVKPSHSRSLQNLKQYGWAVFAAGRGSRTVGWPLVEGDEEKLEARKMLENRAESYTSGARFVRRSSMEIPFYFSPALKINQGK